MEGDNTSAFSHACFFVCFVLLLGEQWLLSCLDNKEMLSLLSPEFMLMYKPIMKGTFIQMAKKWKEKRNKKQNNPPKKTI